MPGVLAIVLPACVTLLCLVCLRLFFSYKNDSHVSTSEEQYATALSALGGDDSHPITVIIPSLDEDAVLSKTIDNLFARCHVRLQSHCSLPKVIVVNAGRTSNDGTIFNSMTTRHSTLEILPHEGPPSRGGQQNFGAQAATSPILLFLHADTLLPQDWDVIVISTLEKDNPPALGAFLLSLPGPISLALRIMLFGTSIRARFAKLPYGDQAYFLRRATFEEVGRFPDVPIMEDVSLLRRIKQKKKGRIDILTYSVQTSPRRWVKNGMVWNTILNQLLMIAWTCGVSPNRIYVWYYGHPPAAILQGATDKRNT